MMASGQRRNHPMAQQASQGMILACRPLVAPETDPYLLHMFSDEQGWREKKWHQEQDAELGT
jgi:tRNA-binding EMAP/Myf-like protein